MHDYKSIEDKINQLPPNLIPELEDYVDYLLSKRKPNRKRRKLKQNWAGALKEYSKKYTSIELQKLALKWRSE